MFRNGWNQKAFALENFSLKIYCATYRWNSYQSKKFKSSDLEFFETLEKIIPFNDEYKQTVNINDEYETSKDFSLYLWWDFKQKFN